MIALNHPDAIRCISKGANLTFLPGMDQCFANVAEDGRILGGVIFTEYRVASIQLSTAGFTPRWLNKDLLFITFDYAFNQLKCKKIICLVASFNLPSMAFAYNIGFTSEAYIEDVFPNGGMHVLSMRPSECRFLNMPKRQIKVVSYGKK